MEWFRLINSNSYNELFKGQFHNLMSATLLTFVLRQIQVVLVLGSAGLVLASPVQVSLKSQLPASPIEDPDTWAWAQ